METYWIIQININGTWYDSIGTLSYSMREATDAWIKEIPSRSEDEFQKKHKDGEIRVIRVKVVKI